MTDLAHFTKADTLIKYILPTKQLKASNLTKLNDPRENKWTENSFSYTRLNPSNTARPPQQFKDRIVTLSNELPEFIRIACFSSYIHTEKQSTTLPEPHLNMRMWAQYGEDHKGACLIIDLETLKEKIESTLKDFHICTNEVNYCNNFIGPTPLNMQTITEQSVKDIDSYFHETISAQLKREPSNYMLTKRTEWRDELELRAVFYSKDKTDLFIPIDNCIKKIYFGVNADEETIQNAKMHLHSTELYKLKIDHSSEDITTISV